MYKLSNPEGLVFSSLTALDNDPSFTPGNINGPNLLGGPTGFSGPTTIGGYWQEKVVTRNVPDSGPSAILPAALLLSMVWFRNRSRRSDKSAA